jgi:hypothetical protein
MNKIKPPTLDAVRQSSTLEDLMALMLRSGALVVVETSPLPGPRYYGYVYEDDIWGPEFAESGRTPLAALRKAAWLWTRHHRRLLK